MGALAEIVYVERPWKFTRLPFTDETPPAMSFASDSDLRSMVLNTYSRDVLKSAKCHPFRSPFTQQVAATADSWWHRAARWFDSQRCQSPQDAPHARHIAIIQFQPARANAEVVKQQRYAAIPNPEAMQVIAQISPARCDRNTTRCNAPATIA